MSVNTSATSVLATVESTAIDGVVPPVESIPSPPATDVTVPTQSIPAQPLWSKLAAVVASIPIQMLPLVPAVDKPAVSVTPVMSPIQLIPGQPL